jgi:hypothetical protein
MKHPLSIYTARSKGVTPRFISVVLTVMILSVALFQAVCIAQDEETSPADTTATSDLFNPPRVIKPEGSGDAAAGRAAVGVAAVTGGETQAEKPEIKKGCASCYRSSRGGGGGQFDIGVAFLDLSAINVQVKQMGIPDLSEEVLILGGRGYGRIGHFIIGGAGYGAWTESSGIPDCCARYARLDFGYGGLILGGTTYGDRHQFMGGVLLGGGMAKITRRRNSREIMGWDDAWDPFKEDGSGTIPTEDLNITSEITGEFIAVEPFITFKYWMTTFMALDFSASYLRAEIGRGQWKLDGVRIPDSPESNLGGPTLKVGIHFGV